MPVHIRNFYYREHSDFIKKQNDEVKSAQQKSQPTIPRRFNPK